MKKLFVSLWVLAALTTGAQAQSIVQSLGTTVPGQGTVSIHQDPSVAELMGAGRIAAGEDQKVIKAPGYRIQAYSGNNTRQAKNDAYQTAARAKDYFPQLPIYTSFIPPRWLCRVGDFQTIEEADAAMRKMKATGQFKEVTIVRDQINIPL
ncbi:MAG: SPOR domain-containing protein [Mediterranea sp.]|jgi:hypothetical protein|nr:SPOR domain-containing protein [Mediterranea sp.]